MKSTAVSRPAKGGVTPKLGRPRGGALARGGAQVVLRNKHLKIDQRKLDLARRHFGVATEQEAIDLALAAFAEEQALIHALRDARGKIQFEDAFVEDHLTRR